MMALKVMHLPHTNIGLMESLYMRVLNEADPNDTSCILRHSHTFKFGASLVLVFELMDNSLESVIQAHSRAEDRSFNSFRDSNSNPHSAYSSASPSAATMPPLTPSPRHQEQQRSFVPMKHLRLIAAKMLSALAFCERLGIIHADLKPENILLTIPPDEELEIEFKLCDFGNAMFVEDISAYFETFELQSLYYRAPEVLVGMNFTTQIDMWSLGCTLCELFTGKPLFHCVTKESLMTEMINVLGPMPKNVMGHGRLYSNYFTSQGKLRHEGFKISFPQAVYDTSVMSTAEMHQLAYELLSSRLKTNNHNFINFLLGLLTFDPTKRLTPMQALSHPFIGSLFPSGLFNAFRMDIDSHHRLRPHIPLHHLSPRGSRNEVVVHHQTQSVEQPSAAVVEAEVARFVARYNAEERRKTNKVLWNPTEAQKHDIEKTLNGLSFRMSLIAPQNSSDRSTLISWLYNQVVGPGPKDEPPQALPQLFTATTSSDSMPMMEPSRASAYTSANNFPYVFPNPPVNPHPQPVEPAPIHSPFVEPSKPKLIKPSDKTKPVNDSSNKPSTSNTAAELEVPKVEGSPSTLLRPSPSPKKHIEMVMLEGGEGAPMSLKAAKKRGRVNSKDTEPEKEKEAELSKRSVLKDLIMAKGKDKEAEEDEEKEKEKEKRKRKEKEKEEKDKKEKGNAEKTKKEKEEKPSKSASSVTPSPKAAPTSELEDAMDVDEPIPVLKKKTPKKVAEKAVPQEKPVPKKPVVIELDKEIAKPKSLRRELLGLERSIEWFDATPMDNLDQDDSLVSPSGRRLRRRKEESKKEEEEEPEAEAEVETEKAEKPTKEKLKLNLSEVRTQLAQQNEKETKLKVSKSPKRPKRGKGAAQGEFESEALSQKEASYEEDEAQGVVEEVKGAEEEEDLYADDEVESPTKPAPQPRGSAARPKKKLVSEYDIYTKYNRSRDSSLDSESQSSGIFKGPSLLASRPQRNRAQPSEWWRSGIDLHRASEVTEMDEESGVKAKKRSREGAEEEDAAFEHPWKRHRKDKD